MPFSPLMIQGRRGLFPLSDPRPRLTRNRTGLDELDETWSSDFIDDLEEGQVHPRRPGMIIDRITSTEDVPAFVGDGARRPGIYLHDVASIGSHDGRRPTKIINRGRRRTLEGGWDERVVRTLSWHCGWKPCRGLSASNAIHCDAHGFADGQGAVFARKTGGSGVVAQSGTSLGQVYFVVEAKANEFKISTAVGGAPLALGSDITACEVIAAEFALGAPHPDHATMYLAELQVQDENTEWKTADCIYRGLEEAKPFHRMVTVDGRQFSSSMPISVSLPGGWMTPLNSNVHLPEVVVTDTYLAGSGSLLTGSVPSFSTPPNPPAIAGYVISADDDQLVFNYPYGWTLVATPHQATLNSQIQAMVYALVYRYVWPVMFK